MMKAAFRGLVGIGIALALSTVISAKGETSKITVAGATLASPIEIADTNVVREFQVWAGPGTTVCIGGRGNCVEGTEGFIVDWSSGTVAQRPSGLQHYEVSFYATDRRFPGQPGPEHLAYVVSYEYDSAASQGYVYLPGKGDQWYALNSASIYRGREGKWFRATRAWQDAVMPLIAHR
jgi:hypothetical protein